MLQKKRKEFLGKRKLEGYNMMLPELRNILDNPDVSIPTRVVHRLILATMAQVIERMDKHDNDISDLSAKIEIALSKPHTCIHSHNVFLKLTSWMSSHPKISISLFSLFITVFLILLTLWLDPSIRLITFEFLHFPASFIPILTK